MRAERLGRECAPLTALFIEDATGVVDLRFGNGPVVRVETRWRPGDLVWRGKITGESALAQIRREGLALRVSRRGATVLTRLMTARAAALSTLMPMEKEADTSKKLRCPMPGLVVSIVVAEGQQVAAGETLAIVEAMKMENVLRAESSGTIARILARPGDSLAVDAVILEFA